MIDKTTSFKKRAKGREGNFKENSKQVATPMKKPKARPKPETECLYYKGNRHQKRNYPKYLEDKKDAKVNKGIFDIHVIDVYLTSISGSPGYLIPVQLLRLVTRNRSCRMNSDKLRVSWRCVLEVIPRLIRSPSHTPYTCEISVEPK